MEINLDRYRQTFFEESSEHLATLEAALLRLETNPGNPESINEAFRAVHSIKGGTAAVGLPAVGRFAHALESLLEQFRSRQGPIPARLLDLLLNGSDALSNMLAAARAGEGPPPGTEELLGQLTRCLNPSDALARPPGLSEGEAGSDKPDAQARQSARPAVTAYTLKVTPGRESLRAGLEPLLPLRDLEKLGKLSAFSMDLSALPALADLDPEACYLTWSVHLESDHPPEAIREVFAFAEDHFHVTIAAVRPDASGPIPSRSGSLLGLTDQVQFSGYLVARGLVSSDQMLAVLHRQQASRPFLWKLAVQEERLTMRQVFDLLEATGAGQHFGETAVSRGLLTMADLGRYFLMQARQVPSLDTLLVAMGVLTADQVQAERARFGTEPGAAPERDDACAPPEASKLSEAPPPPRGSLLADNAEMLGEFCSEADEHLEASDRYLLILDGDPTNREAVNAVYRAYHSIKGVSSMLGLDAVRTLAHEAENMLNVAREGRLTLSGAALDLAFASTDALKRQVGYIRDWLADRGQRMAQDPALPRLLADLKRMTAAPGSVPETPEPAAPPRPAPRPAEPSPVHAPAPEPEEAVAPSPKAEPTTESAREPGAAARSAGPERDTVRVDRARLDKLINAVGELVIAQSMVRQEVEAAQVRGGPSQALSELDKIAGELQELTLSLRMVPLQGTFQKMTRLVRDLSRKIQKPVTLELQGEETELDKSVVDQLGDPLMHMVRNAIDHGLEMPEERVKVGKPAEGRVTLRAFHQGGNVFIALTDDGRGLNRDAIVRKALERGLLSEGQRLSDPEIYALIFEPGFSTAKAVTDVSGRGVGMDVVRRNVEALQGSIQIRTEQGKGTTFTIRLPLTLAILDGLMVGLQEDIYILPLLTVIESFRPQTQDVHSVAGRGEVVTVRGEVVPLLRLAQLLGRQGRVTDPSQGLLVLLEDQGKQYALLVDDLLGQMPVVVKSLDVNFRKVDGVTGATILSDGRVAMILDIPGLARGSSPAAYRSLAPATLPPLDSIGGTRG